MSNYSSADLEPHNHSRDDLTASIIIVTCNGRRYLEGCLSSVLAELWPGCELIVVDNASTDGSPAFIEEYFPGIIGWVMEFYGLDGVNEWLVEN